MTLTITTTHQPATDLGFLLHKHPGRVHRLEMPFGESVVFFPETSEEKCTAALLVDLDPVGLVRGGSRGPEGGLAAHYVNDRPYVASSFLTTTIAKVFGTALGGRSKDRPELAETAIPLEFCLPAVHLKNGQKDAEALFEPLGYSVSATPVSDPPIGIYTLELKAEVTLQRALEHLLVLIPVMDGAKHYWVGQEEVDKLMRRSEAWLAGHPLRETIVRRYLRNDRALVHEALERLANLDDSETETETEETEQPPEEAPKKKLHTQRLDEVSRLIQESGARTILDLGCGEGKLLRRLLKLRNLERLVGLDVSMLQLDRARRHLKLDRLAANVAERVSLLHGSLTYRDRRLEGFEAAAVVEVIEHLEPHRLTAFERCLFEFAHPKAIYLTSPNREYNVHYAGVTTMRHEDHRFEWTRAEFSDWAAKVAEQFGYTVEIRPLGPEDPEVGAPSQLAIFREGGAS